MNRQLLPKCRQAAWGGFLLMVCAWGLLLLSVVLLLEGKSVYGRFWILGAPLGIWLLIIGFLMWTDKQRPSHQKHNHP